MTNSEKKVLAEQLFIYTEDNQKEIAGKVNVTEATMSKWVAAGEWDKKKVARMVTPEKLIQNAYAQLLEMQEIISQRPKGERIPTAEEADIMSKITAGITKLDPKLNISNYIMVFEEWNKFCRQIDLKYVQNGIDYQKSFIEHKMHQIGKG